MDFTPVFDKNTVFCPSLLSPFGALLVKLESDVTSPFKINGGGYTSHFKINGGKHRLFNIVVAAIMAREGTSVPHLTGV